MGKHHRQNKINIRQQFTLKQPLAKAPYKICTIKRNMNFIKQKVTIHLKYFAPVPCVFTLFLPFWRDIYHSGVKGPLFTSPPLPIKLLQPILLYPFPHLLLVSFLFCSFPINAVALPRLYFLHNSHMILYLVQLFVLPHKNIFISWHKLCEKYTYCHAIILHLIVQYWKKNCLQLPLAAIVPQLFNPSPGPFPG